MAIPWTPYQRLALGVIELTVRDAHAGSVDARYFIEGDGPMLQHWCHLLGIQPDTVRRAAEDPGWPARCARAKAALASSWLKPSPPTSAQSPSPTPAQYPAGADPSSPGPGTASAG